MNPAERDDDGPPSLLQTKLHAPRPRRGLVDRPRLSNRLAESLLPPLTVLAAPAGFGKTTLLANWFSDRTTAGMPTAWLSLDPSDNDPTTFWAYVIAAVQSIAPSAGRRSSALLRSSQPLEPVVAALLNDLAETRHETVLILDDYHVIESVHLHDSIAFLVDHLPPHVHLVVGSRADPPLPLARLRAGGDLLEIRAVDLRFTADESATYLNEAMGLALTTADVDALESRTEGWIAALQLAALSLQGREDASGFIASFTGDDRFVVDYLVEEVLERQSDEIRSFLLETAILDRFTAELCDAVTGDRSGNAMLEHLDRANLFLVPLDDRRDWYRYHHLFADVLRARLMDQDPDRLEVLHRRASSWHESHGDRADAIAHALAAHDVENAARLIELTAPIWFRTRQEATARRWLTALPADLLPDRPVLSIDLVGALMVSGEIAGVETVLDGIEPWLGRDADLSQAVVFDHDTFAGISAQVSVYRAALALIAGDTETTIVNATRALDLAGPSNHLQRGSASALVGLALWTRGDLDSAIGRYRNSIASLTAAGHVADVLGCSIALADMQITQGNLRDATDTYRAALELAEGHDIVRGSADMHVGLAELLLERNDIAGAARHLEASSQLGESAGLPQHAYRSRVAAARLRRAEGDLDGSIALLAEADLLYNTDMSPRVRPVAAVKARVQLAAGDLDAAQRWADESGLTTLDELAYVHEFEHLAVARTIIAGARARHDDAAVTAAIGLLVRLLAATEEGGRVGTAIDVLIGLAVAHHALGDESEAIGALEMALVRATPEGHIQIFLEDLPSITPLLRAVSADAAEHHARAVLAAGTDVETNLPDRPGESGLVDGLSPRELDVLRMLRSDLSGPDIARELFVSLNTVRTHTKNIYMKLGVTSRREAVRRAAELGL